MVERIKTIMAYYQMKPAQFSDAIGMQRSAVSHVLSGRNKPSLDFLLRIKRHFPDIRFDWLALGEGDMFEKGVSGGDDLFSGTSSGEKVKRQEVLTSAGKAPASEEMEWKEETRASYGSEPTSLEKEVDKIVFFYRDGTFRAFAPRKLS